MVAAGASSASIMAARSNFNRIGVDDLAALANAAAGRRMARINANPGRIAFCLSGGSSPKQLYRLLSTDPWADRIPWQRGHWLIGDERFGPADDPLDNMAMARRTFLDSLAPPANIHPIPTDTAGPDESAHRYEGELKAFYGASRLDPTRPLFDLVLMGAATAGNPASLFPDDPALKETTRWVIGVGHAHVEPLVPRVTLTLPALSSCREMLFEIAGAEKRAILTRLSAGENLPANRARSAAETVWLVDRAA